MRATSWVASLFTWGKKLDIYTAPLKKYRNAKCCVDRLRTVAALWLQNVYKCFYSHWPEWFCAESFFPKKRGRSCVFDSGWSHKRILSFENRTSEKMVPLCPHSGSAWSKTTGQKSRRFPFLKSQSFLLLKLCFSLRPNQVTSCVRNSAFS